MNNKMLRKLEYNKIIDLLVRHADSVPGKELCRNLEPISDKNEIITMQKETSAALSRLIKKGNISFSGTENISISLKRLELGNSLSISEILKTAALLENASAVKKYGKRDRAQVEDDCLDAIFDSLIPIDSLSSDIRKAILSESEVSDNASPELSKIRRSIKNCEDKIHSQLSAMLSGQTRTYLQDGVITMRNGRYCIPVKAEYRSQVQGMIHDQSSSGSTYFIEPMSVVKLNNDIRSYEAEEAKEIEKILSRFSQQIFENIEAILSDMELLIKLDFIFARAALALEMNAVEPIFNYDGIINLKKARHPLIDKKKVVPIDIRLGEDFDLLVITGPNTGGKTVALKTVGLLTLMGQSGLHIPTLSQSQLSVFDNIFADIGDEQSIEQSLSTFSSHMKTVVTIIKKADDRSLVLFDELGAGTDPIEGAALAQSILSYFHKLQIRTIATTHYSELKLYALSTSGVENASCEFDVKTLSPTYRLLIGVPGKSNAFAISKKLGLPKHIIEDAQGFINDQNEAFEDVVTKLEQNRIEIEKEREKVKQLRLEAEHIKNDLLNREKEFKEKKSNMNQRANEEAYAALKEAKDYANSIMKSFRKVAENTPQFRELEKQREQLRLKMNKAGQAISIKTEKKPAHKALKPSEVNKGDTVKVLSMNLKGTVFSKPDSKGFVLVQVGIIRSKVHISDLELINEPSVTAKGITASGGAGRIKLSKTQNISPEINVIGKKVDEAVALLDKYLDDAYLSHLNEVRIVHGKGTGSLRNGIHAYLKTLSIVKDFHLAAYGEGDAGVTIVKFRNT